VTEFDFPASHFKHAMKEERRGEESQEEEEE